ncbi:MAG: hypothetical protein U9Q04_00140, partial [Campylobacterota bacterium]|nr:hypothetical protein [Campylobacterota bacterium]
GLNMSMSQEEIEALMNGVDLSEDDSSESEAEEAVSLDESETEVSVEVSDDDVDDILAGIEGITDDASDEADIDDTLSGIDGITNDEVSTSESAENSTSESAVENLEELTDQNKYPLPVEKEHKVVNQLNEVAEDSEQKASQIFDVLSFVLDENNEIQNFNKQNQEFINKQTELLESLASKFPNIDVFKENLELAAEAKNASESLSAKVDDENMKIFEAMELMQYHDINRQKIERVMSVIRKLSDYLNGIFEDDSGKPEVQIAKHISGDSTNTVDDDDLESLIAEFNN